MRKRKLLLVSANRYEIPYPVYPIGLSFIATYLTERLPDFDIRIFDFIMNDMSEFNKYLSDFKPDYVGISLRNIDDVNLYSKESFISGYKEITDIVKAKSKARIIFGGAGFSIFPGELIDLLSVDFGIAGEGEESFYQLIELLESGGDYSDISGLVYKDNGKTIVNNRRNSLRRQNLSLTYDDALIDYYWNKSGMLSIQTKRGCPKECIYCTYPLIEGHKVRTFDTYKVVETLKELSENKGIDYFFITDSIFNIDDEYNREFAELIIDRGVKVKWGAYFAPHNLDPKLLKLLKKAGLTHIEFGTDSICDTQLKNYNKNFTVSDVIESSKLCNEAGIYFAHFLILGGYGENEETIAETFENSKRIKNSVFFPFIGMRVYPGTKLERIVSGGGGSASMSLIDPSYYLSEDFDLNKLKENSKKTGQRWVFPDENTTAIMEKMRRKNIKGPLWEYLIK